MLKTTALILMALAGSARAADPLYQPAPDWVRPVDIPADVKPSGAAVEVLLLDRQSRLTPGDDEVFVETATRINAPEGLSQIGNLAQPWNPLTETLTFHRLHLIRAGKVIDLLAGGRRFTVLRRETNLEAAMIDGELTATLQPEGLQVGDVLDLAFTLARHEPALAGHSEAWALLGHTGTVGRLSFRASWPATGAVRTWTTDDLPALHPSTHGGWAEVGFDLTSHVSPEPPRAAPLPDSLFGWLMLGDFKDWADVSRTAQPLYAKAAVITSTSPLQVEIARIRAASGAPKAQALAALELVQSRIRYLYVGIDAGGYTPASADETWTRRFGDCKGKTVLLLALLQGLGIKAEPALVSSAMGDGLDKRLPMLSDFDHVLVRVDIGGRVYWLDGTRIGDESLDILPIPNFHWALPLRREGGDLERLTPKPLALPLSETRIHIDARAGIDKPAHVHEELIWREDAALAFSLGMKSASRIDADRGLRQLITSDRSWIKPEKVDFTYDPQRMEARVVMDGAGTPPFTSPGSGLRDWVIEGASIGADVDLVRRTDFRRAAPYAVTYPLFYRTVIELDLPDSGRNFEALNGGDVNKNFGSMSYSRAAKLVDGRLTVLTNVRALGPSFPANDGPSVQAGLHEMASYDVSVRYSPPKTPLSDLAPDAAATPVERATAAFGAKNYTAAASDFTVALAAGPSAKLYYDRAAARAALGEEALAEADLNAALALDPKHVFALLGLGRYALARGDVAVASRWFNQALAYAVNRAQVSETIASVFEEAGKHAESISYWDTALSGAIDPKARAVLLNNSCWSRAAAGVELKRALDNCNEAIRSLPNSASWLESRGFVELRLGESRRAIDDYSAALAATPGLPTALFGRSLAEARLGLAERAAADRAAAVAVDPKIELTFRRLGVR